MGFEIGDRSEYTGNKLYDKLKHNKPESYCTDCYEAYNIFLRDENHISSKAETYTIEGVNNIIRHYLARFKRKTHCYSKSVEVIKYTLLLFFYKRNYKCIPF